MYSHFYFILLSEYLSSSTWGRYAGKAVIFLIGIWLGWIIGIYSRRQAISWLMFWTKNKLCFPWTCGSCVWFPDQHKACTFLLWCSCDNSMLCNYSRLISSRTQLEHELQLKGDIYAHYNGKHVQIKDIYSLSALLYWSKWSMEKAVCIWCHILMRYREIQKSKEDRLMSTVKNVLCQIQFLMVKQKKLLDIIK